MANNIANDEMLNIYLHSAIGTIELILNVSRSISKHQEILKEQLDLTNRDINLLSIEDKNTKKKLPKNLLSTFEEIQAISSELQSTIDGDIDIVSAVHSKALTCSANFEELYGAMLSKSQVTQIFNYNGIFDELTQIAPDLLKLLKSAQEELINSHLKNDVINNGESLENAKKELKAKLKKDSKNGIEDESIIELDTIINKVESTYDELVIPYTNALFEDYRSLDAAISLTDQLINIQVEVRNGGDE